MTLREAITALLHQVDAPDWARPNLDGLADVLRDLSWHPDGAVTLAVPAVDDPADAARLGTVLARAAAETADGPHPVRV